MVPKTPTGMFTQKTARQSQIAQPAGDQADELPGQSGHLVDPERETALGAGNASVRIAAELAVSMDPPIACSIRQPISHTAPRPPWNGLNDSRIDAAVNTANP
jgi:hypothetical protein